MKFATILSATLALAASGVVASPLTSRDENAEAFKAIGYELSKQSHYGAPKRPGQHGATPGWYYGKRPKQHPGLPCLTGNICKILTHFPNHLQCPRPPPHHSTTTTTTTKTTTATTTSKTTTTTTVTASATTTVTVTGGGSGGAGPSTSTRATTSPAATPSTLPGVITYTPLFHNATGATEADDYLTFGLVDTIEDCWEMCNTVASCGFVNTYHDVNGKDGSTQLTCALFQKCHTVAESTNYGGQNQLGEGILNYITESDGWCQD